jgi:hypothetical protein
MRTHSASGCGPRTGGCGVTRCDVLAVVGTLAVVGMLVTPVIGREGVASQRMVCQSNVRALLAAVTQYAADHGDAMPHPSWGSVGASAGPDNWCYATRTPDGVWIPSVEGLGGPFAHTNQLPFYAEGQLAPFLGSQRTMVCPTDWRQVLTDPRYGTWYRGRTAKLTSYAMNGAVSGYGNVQPLPQADLGATHKRSAFSGADFLLWEADEMSPFNFNDAAANPLNAVEGVSRRHARITDGVETRDAIVGRIGGTAEFIPWSRFGDLRRAGGQGLPNELICGPSFEP